MLSINVPVLLGYFMALIFY